MQNRFLIQLLPWVCSISYTCVGECGWWEGSGWVGWPVARQWKHHDVVQTDSNMQHPVTQWFGLMTSLYSVRSSHSFISIHHTVYKHIYCLLTGQFADTNSLYSYSLHLDSQRPPSFTMTCTRKSKQSTTTSIDVQCTTSLQSHLTSSQFHTHSPNSRNLLRCMANQIPDQSIQPITKDPIATKLIHFLDQSSTLTMPTPTSTCNAHVWQM